MKTIILDTKDSYTNEPYNASWNLTNYTPGSSKDSTIALQSVILPNLVYPVNSNNNTVLFSEDGAGSFTATLTEGTYSSSEIISELKTKMDAVGSNAYTVTYNSNTFKITIATSGTSVQLLEDSTAQKVLGFPSTGSADASSITSSYPIRLDGSQYVDIITSLPSSNIVSDNRPVFTRIPLAVAYGELLFYMPPVKQSLPLKHDSVITLDMRLTDDEGNSFELPINANIQYTFQIE